ncbi:MAG: hypothetical protein QOD86_449 [Miltoncostaeaceae bacterium]|nr:hypothetical protein [Miltoncostaeaceae bacterium]
MGERRLELGFEGGTVVRLTVTAAVAAELTDGLAGGGSWRSVAAEEGTYWINQDDLVYVRLAPQALGRVGFASSAD